MLFAAFCALTGLAQAFGAPYVVQDDAEQHVWWMLRFIEPGLFPGDLAADYYASVAPPGYVAIYRAFAMLGVDAILLSKLLPMGLGLVATAYGYFFMMRLFPIPFAGFMAMALLNLRLWMLDDLVTGTARAFLHPLCLAFLYYLASRAAWPCLLTIALTGLIYPQLVILQAGLLAVRLLADAWRVPRENSILSLAGLAVAGLTLLPYALKANAYGPVVTAELAKTMPEWGPEGRHHFYTEFWKFWLTDDPSGMLPFMGSTPPLMLAGFLLPLMLGRKKWLPLAEHLQPAVKLLPQLALASVGLFFAAHAVLFHLYLPSRYTQHTAWILLAIAAGVVLAGVLEWLVRHIDHRRISSATVVAVLVGMGIVLMLPVTSGRFPRDSYEEGGTPGLYRFLGQQPKDTLIASLSYEADRIPIFTRRSVLVSHEVAIAFHQGYYRQMRTRAIALLKAQYSPSPEPLLRAVDQYGIDLWLLDRWAFKPQYLVWHLWLQQFEPTVSEAADHLAEGRRPALAGLIDRSVVYEDDRFIVLSTRRFPRLSGEGGRRPPG